MVLDTSTSITVSNMPTTTNTQEKGHWGIGLNLGCGPLQFSVIDGIRFLNIDNDSMYLKYAEESKEEISFAMYDLTKGLPETLLDSLTPIVFVNMSQFLEHVNLPAAELILSQCYNYMTGFDNETQAGRIRISVPDSELLIHLLRTNSMDKLADCQPPEWFNKYNSEMMKFSLILFGSLTETGETGHKMCYSFDSLKELLEHTGFTNVRRMKHDSRFDAPVAESHQLCVEAIKP